jgi:uncharacterized protein YqeY
MTATSLKEQITQSMKDAMRARDKERLGTIRLMQSEIKRIEVDERIELDDARVLQILDKMIKQRRDSAKQFRDAERTELAVIEEAEIKVIEDFMPAQLSADEISSLVSDAIASSGASSMADMGKVMAILRPQVQGKADMGAVSQLVKGQLG